MKTNNKLMYEQIGVSWLHKYAFCEYQLYLEFIQGIEPPITKEIIDGNESHVIMQDKRIVEGKSQGLERLTDKLDKMVNISISKDVLIHDFDYKVECDILIGMIDEIIISKKNITIIDDKPRTKDNIPYFTDRLQIYGYCYCVKRQYPTLNIPINCIIRDESNGDNFWEHEYSNDDDIFVDTSAKRSLAIINNAVKATPTNNIKKCYGCRYNNDCDHFKGVHK